MSIGADHRNAAHAQALALELDWLEAVLNLRLEQHFQQHAAEFESALPPPELPPESALAALVAELALGPVERIVLALAMAPHLRPGILDLLFVRNQNLERGFTEFGGWKAQHHSGFLPTGETAAFLVAGDDLARRIALLDVFDARHPFTVHDVVRLDGELASHEPQLSGILAIGAETLQRLQTGGGYKPDYNIQFPAKRITTRLGWHDLVLAPDVMDEIQVIQTWLRQGEQLMRDWGLSRAVKPGYRSLFYGPPGTGKTLTATLLGQNAGVDVYRIDLSMVVSKYIGETEKNLARVFDQAQNRRWVLFFDEADALFGKRAAVQSSNDRHANQEIAYLLQRVEDFPGAVILASNLRGNIDEAFARRLQSMVYFPMPDASQRLKLWRGLLPESGRLADDVDLESIAEQHVLSGGAIVNVMQFAVLQAARSGAAQIASHHLRVALAKELSKEGRTVG